MNSLTVRDHPSLRLITLLTSLELTSGIIQLLVQRKVLMAKSLKAVSST